MTQALQLSELFADRPLPLNDGIDDVRQFVMVIFVTPLHREHGSTSGMIGAVIRSRGGATPDERIRVARQ